MDEKEREYTEMVNRLKEQYGQPAPQAAQPQYAQQPTPQAAQPQYAQQPAPQAAQPQYAQQPAPQTAQPQYGQPAPQAAQSQYAQQPAPQTAQPQYAQQPAPQAAQPQYTQQPAPQESSDLFQSIFGGQPQTGDMPMQAASQEPTIEEVFLPPIQSEVPVSHYGQPVPQAPQPQYVQQPAPQVPQPQYAQQPAPQAPQPQYAQQPAPQTAQPQYAQQPTPQTAQLQYAQQPAPQTAQPQYVQQPAPQAPQSQYAQQPAPQAPQPQPSPAEQDGVAAAWETVQPQPILTNRVRREPSAAPNPDSYPQYESLTFEDLLKNGAYNANPTPLQPEETSTPEEAELANAVLRASRAPSPKEPMSFGDFAADGQPKAQTEGKPAKKEKKEIPQPASPTGHEYTDDMQHEMLLAFFRRRYRRSKWRIGICALLTLFTFLYENIRAFNTQLPQFLQFTEAGKVGFLVLDDLLLFCSCCLMLPVIIRGTKALFHGLEGLQVESILPVMLVVTALYHLGLLASDGILAMQRMNTVMQLIFLILAIAEMLKLHCSALTFDVMGAPGTKIVLKKTQSPAVCRTAQTDFVEDIFAGIGKDGKSKRILQILIPFSLIIGIVFFVLCLILKDGTNGMIYAGMRAAYLSFLMCAPVPLAFLYAIPVWRASARCFKHDAAFLGESAVDDVAGLTAVEVSDTTVCLPAKVTGLSMYGARVDYVIRDIASALDAIGGPLAEYMGQYAKALEFSKIHRLTELAEDGIEVIVQEQRTVQIGTADYLRRKHYDIMRDPSAEAALERGDYATAYAALDGKIVCSFRVQYELRPAFVKQIPDLREAGIGICVRTADPFLQPQLVRKLLEGTRVTVMVRKLGSIAETQTKTERSHALFAYSPMRKEEPDTVQENVLETEESRRLVTGELTLLESVIQARLLRADLKRGIVSQTVFTVCGMFLLTFFLSHLMEHEVPSMVPSLFLLLASVPQFFLGVEKSDAKSERNSTDES